MINKFPLPFLMTIGFAVLLSACSTLDFAPANSNSIFQPTVTAQEVLIFRSDHPKAPYKEIGLLHFKGPSRLSSVMHAMKEEAAAKGGNAVIDIKIIPGGTVGTVVLIE